MSIQRIDQFAASVAVGDGVTNSLLFTRELLHELGYASEIFSYCIPEALTGNIRPARTFKGSKDTLLLYHHSMGHDYGDWLLSLACPKALVYHNITPADFFPAESGLRRYALLGRQQLIDWRDEFIGAIADSPLNRSELESAHYADARTLPLLVDSHRLEGQGKMPAFIQENSAAAYYLCVGRLAENKQQHLLIEAFHHLLQLQGSDSLKQARLLLVGGTTSEDYARGLMHHINQLGLQGQVLLPGKCSDAELRWLYRNAHQYWCASAHEGFCMPLLEAQHAGLPIIACAQSNVPETLGEGGLLLADDAPLTIALTAQLLDETDGLRGRVVAAGKRNLERFDRQLLKQQLATWIELILASARKEYS
ncbi:MULTISPECIES: glycosyltransferase [Gammaproteobacteria]|uniref:glycosyltransferase n=1 Tax=Gammaproteobacteria TaxID=1236 RepID=UPI003A928E10